MLENLLEQSLLSARIHAIDAKMASLMFMQKEGEMTQKEEKGTQRGGRPTLKVQKGCHKKVKRPPQLAS